MESFIKILIYIHAFFGGLGLTAGIVSILVRKGGKVHKLWGKIFSVSMIKSSLLSLIVASFSGHENMFLFLIGIFTIYMVLAGNRALTLKVSIKNKANALDKGISYMMFAIAVVMLIFGTICLVKNNNLWTLFFFFGGIGLLMTYRDFRAFKEFTTNNKVAIVSHIGRMVGAFITSVTAFIVAGLSISNLLVWLLPTLLGIPYIVFWIRKIKTVKI